MYIQITSLQWETVILSKLDGSYDLQRVKVPGGWLVRTYGDGMAMCFMPDGNHVWTVASGYEKKEIYSKRDPAVRSKVLMELDEAMSSSI